MKELNTNRQLAPLVAQVVPIKIKIGTEAYSQWSRQHRHEGNGIPIVYIVRADGKTLYARSGKPKTEVLGQMLTAALSDAGYILTDRDITNLVRIKAEFSKHHQDGNVAAAMRSLRKAKNYLDGNGNVASYAASAIALQEQISGLMAEAVAAVEECQQAISEANQDQAIVQSLEQFESIKATYNSIKPLKERLSKIQATINKDKSMKATQSALRVIRVAHDAKTKTSKERSMKKLEALISDPPSELILERAKAALSSMESAS